MDKNYYEELNILKNKLNELDEKYNNNNKRIHELIQIPEVAEYERLVTENENIRFEVNNLSEKYIKIVQENCKHPLWYFISDETDSYEMRITWKCKCLDCGLVEIDRAHEFNSKILMTDAKYGFPKSVDAPYHVVASRYNELKQLNQLTHEQIIGTIFGEFTNNKKKSPVK